MFDLPRLRVLDPRPADRAAEAPLVDAVNLPWTELKDALSELPPKEEVVFVADVEGADDAERFLRAGGRMTQRVRPEFGEAPRGRLWEPNSLVRALVASQAPGVAVDLGAGAGRDALFLAAHGWKVIAVDHSRRFRELGEIRARRYLSDPGRIDWQEQDASDFSEFAEVDLVLSLRFLDRTTLRRSGPHLIKGARVLVQCFHPDHRAETGHPRDADLAATPDDVLALLGPTFYAETATVEVIEGKKFTALSALKAK